MNANAKHPTKTIIGLEVHVQLKTDTKLFCGCSTNFGAPPNTQVCPTCLGMPGALPVMNEQAISLSVKAGLAINCEIPPMSKWDRKQYFYPDSPKGYQISQFDLPICAAGYLEIDDPANEGEIRRIGITRAHLEEDAGKSMHDEAAGRGDTRIDLNRCGTPLLEIVSEPDMRSAAEAQAYLTKLKALMIHMGVSDCEMQQGSLRVDANVNLHIDNDGEKVATPIAVPNKPPTRTPTKTVTIKTATETNPISILVRNLPWDSIKLAASQLTVLPAIPRLRICNSIIAGSQFGLRRILAAGSLMADCKKHSGQTIANNNFALLINARN